MWIGETGSLRTVQQILWHLADRNADALAALHTEDDDAGPIARAWIKTHAKDAQGQVTADFEGEGLSAPESGTPLRRVPPHPGAHRPHR